MSDPKLISPLLDGFSMGNPISEHHGVRCCPAIKENTDKKYIVKVITIPASQAQMDALLLAGAYKDPAQAMEYFHEKGEAIIKEAQMLKKLSKLEGFLSYDGWQMEPITKYRLGYELYLVGSYKRSLEKYMRHHAVTHLEAVNLGLDMCAALSVCRQAGALYVDLKPSNIFMSDRKEYRIGDLGFLPLDELRYSALPVQYQSSYTPPELYDPMNSVNLTADTYALGMLLYQLYNDGNLPFKGRPPEEALPTPVNADYELAEIISKAIHPDPEQRFADPAQMGKALASYMQRNTINDVAITPLRIKKARPKKQDAPSAEESPEKVPVAVGAETEAAEASESQGSEIVSPEETPAEPDADSPVPVEEEQEPIAEEAPADEEMPAEAEDSAQAEDTPIEENAGQEPELSGELSAIFSKVEDILTEEEQEESIPQEEPEEDPFAFATDDIDELSDEDFPYDPPMEEEEEIPQKRHTSQRKFADPKYKRRRKKLVSFLVTGLILALIAAVGLWYYQTIYLLKIDSLTLEGSENQILVKVQTAVDESLLSVSCLDNFGNAQTQPLVGGTAAFTDLQPDTMYIVQLQAEGFHSLIGMTSDSYTTEATTSIVSFTSMAGAEDGSVMLTFTVDGQEPEQWSILYTAEGETEMIETFSGHTVTISGLTLGKVYTFTLDPGEGLSLGGQTSLELMATRLILAENLRVASSSGSDMTVSWDAPGDAVVESWNVRCYSAAGYDEQATVTGTQAQFTGIDPNMEYTIEVTAAGMTQPARTGITANPINISALNLEDNATELKATWEFTGTAAEGWLLMYTVDGGEASVVKSDKAEAVIAPKIPGGRYTFTLHAADNTTIFNNVHSYTAPDAPAYTGNKLTAEQLSMELVKTPEGDWHAEDLGSDSYGAVFAAGDPMSIALYANESFYLPGTQTKVMYVIRDAYGNVLTKHIDEKTVVWKDIWDGGDAKNGELSVTNLPTNPGEYTLALYFDGMAVGEKTFTIS